MLRVLHCIYDDPRNPWVGGGGAVRTFEIYRRLAPRLSAVTVATGNYPGARNETIAGIDYVRLGARAPYIWSRLTYARAATRLLQRGDYDAAVFDFSTYTLIRVPRDRPVGVTVHHLSEESAQDRWGSLAGRVVAATERARLRRATLFSATSLVMQEHLRELAGVGATIRLVQAGVPDEMFAIERHESDYLLYFGRLDWFHKGLDVLLEAMAILVRTRPSLRLRIAGRGRDLERVTAAAQTLGISANIECLGAVSDEQRQQLFAGAQVMLMPSRFEGFGMAAAEAMAAGVPLVASDAGSLPEVVAAPQGGVIVAQGDAPALAHAVDELLGNADARARLSRGARSSAERFRWDRVADDHLAFLNAIHEGRSNDA
jgi:glycosyltransferase involved in cell wall biosynthesis